MWFELPEHHWRTLTELWLPLGALLLTVCAIAVTLLSAAASSAVAVAAWRTATRATRIAEEGEAREQERLRRTESVEVKRARRDFARGVREYFLQNASDRRVSDSLNTVGYLELRTEGALVEGFLAPIKEADRLLDETSQMVNWRDETADQRADRFHAAFLILSTALEIWVDGSDSRSVFVPLSGELVEPWLARQRGDLRDGPTTS